MDVETSGFIPEELPFCTIPPFTNPTFVPREPELVPPDVMLPDICRCFTFEYTSDVEIGGTGTPGLDLSIHRSTDNCCELAFSVFLDGNIPCMPFTFDSSASLTFGNTADIHLSVGQKNTDNCEYEMQLDIGGETVIKADCLTQQGRMGSRDCGQSSSVDTSEQVPKAQVFKQYVYFDFARQSWDCRGKTVTLMTNAGTADAIRAYPIYLVDA